MTEDGALFSRLACGDYAARAFRSIAKLYPQAQVGFDPVDDLVIQSRRTVARPRV
jgi:hypothetical protein